MCELEMYLSLQIFCLDRQLAQVALDLWPDTSTPSERHVHTHSAVFRGNLFDSLMSNHHPPPLGSTFTKMWYTLRQYITDLMTCVTRPVCQRACIVF